MAEIIDIKTPWEGLSGNQVEGVVKQTLNEKIGAEYFDPATNTKYNFKDADTLAEWIRTGDASLIQSTLPYNFTGTMYQVKVNSEMSSKTLYFTTQAEKAEITVSFTSQKKGITDVSWQDIVEDYNVSVYIDRGSTGAFTPLILDQFVISGNTLTFDVKKALATGANRVRVVAVGTESADKTQGSEMFIVNLTSMYLAPSNFTWYKPFIEGETYILGGMNIGGSGLNKTLKIRVSKEGYEKLYEIAYGTGINTDTAYTFSGLEFPSAGTGVYNVELWLDANGLESDHLSYNIICVSAADKFTAQLVAIGSPAKTVYNFSDNKLFEYSIYNGGTATGSPHIKVSSLVNTNPTVLIDEDLVGVATASPLTYTASLEIEMEDESASLQLEAYMTYGNEQQIVFPVDNSKSYPATTGAVFYMNPSSRNNAQSNREKVINSITSAEMDAVFTRMAWTDGTDGWTTDEEGRKCLRLPAGCTMDLAYQPMASVAQKTIELVYKVKNAADYDEPIFSICSDVNDPNFRGIVIRPKNILIHSRDLNVNDSLQDYNTTDEETLHVLITIIPNYKTNYGNLAQIYVNGDKVRSFSFETADRWDVTANMKFGSNTADTYWYKARVYDKGFEMYDASKNTINSLATTAEKEAMKAKMEAPLDDSYNLSYDECVKNGLNTMVIEILDQDQTVPSIVKPSAKQCNLWVKINNPIDGELDADFARLFSGEIIENQTIEGQGTTAMTYARWNFRWKLDSTYNKRRITAKKNVASSPHANKMGGTRSYNDLYIYVVGPNDAGARLAVYQYPVYGFQKIKVEGTTDQYTYVPIGLYTIGPDKGDKKTFGYDDARFEDTVIHMEGTDHTPKAVGMDYPWEELAYSGSAEALGAINATGNVVAAWEVGAAGEYDPKDNPTEVKAMLEVEFKPAYKVAELNSTYIWGVHETVAEMNADITSWQAKKDAFGRTYAGLEFFTDGVYDLYFYNIRTQQYVSRGINMLTDLGLTADDVAGLTLDEKTELFKNKRRERFVAEWGNYWLKDSAIFNYTFLEMIGATDNFKKNSYPQKFRALADGGRWEWRNDDLDSLMDIINQGLAGKLYSILVGDKDSTGSIYAGDNSVFWTLIRETQQVEIKAMVHRIFDAMVELCPSGYGDTTLQKLVGFVRYYFWDKAQNYFPTTAYCKDAEWTYEDTWAAGLYREVNPLSQSLGGHYEAQRDWITMRMLFMAMYYNYGPFADYNDAFSDVSTGQIAYGGADAHTFDIEMACDGNPTILRGQSEYVAVGRRVKEGEVVQLTVPDSNDTDTRIYIQGVDWYKSIGDLCNLILSVKNPRLSVASKRLQTLKVGDEDASKVTTNMQGLDFGECPSMMIVDARNAKSLTGTIDLSKMPRLLEAYFGGTGVKAVNVPNGAKIETLELGEETTQIALMNLKFMENEGFQYTALPKLELLRIENCPQLSPFLLLKGIYETEGNVIRDIRIIGFDVEGDASDFTMIANMANDVDKDGNEHIYNGITAEGALTPEHPVIEGTLSVAGNVYEDDYNAIKAVFPNLNMSFLGFYLSFADPEVLRVLLAKMTTDDGVGITVEQAEAVTSISTWFRDNTVIETFDELKRFTGLTQISTLNDGGYGASSFRLCTALRSIGIPENVTRIGSYSFNGCASLENVEFTNKEGITDINASAFDGCSLLDAELDFPNLVELGARAFSDCAKIRKISNLGKITQLKGVSNTGINGGDFFKCLSLEEAHFPSTLIKIGLRSLYGCTALTKVTMPSVQTIETQAFYGCTALLECEMPSSLVTINSSAFYNCTSLSFDELNLPNLTTFGQYALHGVKIKKLSIPKVATLSVGNGSGSPFNFGDKSILEEVVLSENLTAIPNYLFLSASALKKVSGIKGVTAIGIRAFYNCTSLESIDIDWSPVKTIADSAFLSCPAEMVLDAPNLITIAVSSFKSSGLVEVKNMGSVTTINSGSATPFYQCTKLTRVVWPETLTTMGQWQFYLCSNLKEVIISNTTPITLGNTNAFQGTHADLIIAVPAASMADYAAATNWSTHASRLVPLEDHEDGGYVKFADAAVEAICVANWDTNGSGYMSKNECAAVTSIGTVFKGNTEITSFDEFENFTGISALGVQEWTSNNAPFYECSSLESIVLPPSIKAINYVAFGNCSSLNNINLDNVNTIFHSAFMNCSNLDIDVIAPSLTGSLGTKAFYGTGVRRVLNLGSITKINGDGWSAGTFQNCPNLEVVILPETLTSIGLMALGSSSITTCIVKNPSPATLAEQVFSTGIENIYVPDANVADYQAATNWSTYASRIKGISQLATDNPTLYAEIEEYL